MPTITFDRFDSGLDLTRHAATSDPGKLQVLKNAFVTPGRTLKKRPGAELLIELADGTVGLTTAGGVIHTFSTEPGIASTDEVTVNVIRSHRDPNLALSSIVWAEPYAGFLYVVAEYEDGSITHHYLDGSATTHIEDEFCPHTRQVTKIAEKIWAAEGDSVRYTATANPRDWSTTEDAGAIPAGARRAGSVDIQGLGQYQNQLAVFFDDGVQVWSVDPDPSLIVLINDVDSTGTIYSRSIRSAWSDLFFLSRSGYRSVSVAGFNRSEEETDIGTPIEQIVRPLLNEDIDPIAAFYAAEGQYWCFIGSTAHVFSFSRFAKLRAWSEYEFPFAPTDVVEAKGTLYLRAGNSVYAMSDQNTSDDGLPIDVVIEFAFLDFKNPGLRKMIKGLDVVMEGEANVSFRFDNQQPDLISRLIRVRGNMRPGLMTPVELNVTACAPRITHSSDDEFELHAISLMYEQHLQR